MTLLFGLKYAAAGPLFAVLALTLPFHFATKPSVNLLAVRSPRILTWIYLGMLLANLLANFIVIPRAGASGAAWVWVAGEAGLFLACAWPTWDSLDRKASFRWVPAGLAACAVVGFCISRDP
ncbi:MAG TPA: polysaccharide biosynthesis C-terminal domain-containing protein, partial [bacterium]|nr:polysaccharide biosynthesis C-terminal domain-containing protein [bacterium]